jgi:hypothetical protein
MSMDHSSVARIFKLGEAMKAVQADLKTSIDDAGPPSAYTTPALAKDAYDKVKEYLREYEAATRAYRDALLAIVVEDEEDATDGLPFMSV